MVGRGIALDKQVGEGNMVYSILFAADANAGAAGVVLGLLALQPHIKIQVRI